VRTHMRTAYRLHRKPEFAARVDKGPPWGSFRGLVRAHAGAGPIARGPLAAGCCGIHHLSDDPMRPLWGSSRSHEFPRRMLRNGLANGQETPVRGSILDAGRCIGEAAGNR